MTPVAVWPSAITHAPVSVAASITAAGDIRFANASTSASTSRPSASVLMISMNLPFDACTTSPGFIASPDGMFVVEPMRPTTLIGSSNRPIASMAPSTPAAPHMSNFIHSMPCAGLIEMPPESKHSPLPTSTIGFASFAPFVVLEHDQLRLLRRALRDGEERAHLRSRSIAARPSTVVVHAEPLGDVARRVGEIVRRADVARQHAEPRARANVLRRCARPRAYPSCAPPASAARITASSSGARCSSAGGGVFISLKSHAPTPSPTPDRLDLGRRSAAPA